MIVYLICALIVIVVCAWTMISNRPARVITGVLSGIALICAVGALTMNTYSHYGMKKVTKTTSHKIYSAAGSKSLAGILVAKKMGTKANRYVLVYADHKDGKATTHNVPSTKHIINSTKKHASYQQTNTKEAKVVTKTTRWEWKNNTYKTWLSVGDQAGELHKQKTTVYVPKDTWLVLSPTQMKKLKALMVQSHSSGNTQAAAMQQVSGKSKDELAKLAVAQVKAKLNQ